MTNRGVLLIGFLSALLILPGSFQSASGAETVTAGADLSDASGRPVGKASFSQIPEGATLTVEVRDLPPGRHGIHLHSVGLCEPPAFLTAGPHFNPAGKKHGLKNPEGPHAGDLPNLEVGSDGTGRMKAAIPGLSKPVGLAVVIHAGPDDEMTDPAGNSGARIACGVVGKRP